jgi:hypothetical protein
MTTPCEAPPLEAPISVLIGVAMLLIWVRGDLVRGF